MLGTVAQTGAAAAGDAMSSAAAVPASAATIRGCMTWRTPHRWVWFDPLVSGESYVLRPIGWVQSPLIDQESAPKQGDEGAPEAWVVFDTSVRDAVRDVRPGTEVLLLTWLDRARRDVLVVHPRDDLSRPETGVFSTRSADRPNPIGLHRVAVLD